MKLKATEGRDLSFSNIQKYQVTSDSQLRFMPRKLKASV